MNLNLPISFDSMSYISLSTNLVAKCDIQVDAAKVADIFDLPKFGATFLPLEERIEYIRRVFAFSKNTFRVKRRGGGVKPPILLESHPIPIITFSLRTPHHLTPQHHLTPSLLLLIIYIRAALAL